MPRCTSESISRNKDDKPMPYRCRSCRKHFSVRTNSVLSRTDIPRRTDIEAPIPYRQNKHVLFGQQEGLCNGCQTEFLFRIFEVDHRVPRSRGGTGHLENLQLLCSSCNRIKGDRPQEYLVARLAGTRA